LMPGHSRHLHDVCELVTKSRKLLVLTGAGTSTLSGLPDYRGPAGVYKANPNYKPIMYGQFVRHENARRRYWARSAAGWTRFASASPSAGHIALAELGQSNRHIGIITQNVDGLHHRAGSQNVVELHGNLHKVTCLECQAVSSRQELQTRFELLNPDLPATLGRFQADGDVELDPEVYERFQIPSCEQCSGVLKPAVTFFGENIAKSDGKKALEMIHDADALLIVGTTLTVWSAYRLVLAAAALANVSSERLRLAPAAAPTDREHALALAVHGARPSPIPIAILNKGPTRGDWLAAAKAEDDLAESLRVIRDHVLGS